MFENVTYTFYCDTLGRATVPTEQDFNELKLESLMFVKNLVDEKLVKERVTNGIDSAICMMIEEEYKANEIAKGKTNIDTSESIGGYSHSMNTKAYDVAIEKNAKSLDEKKYKWLKTFCEVLQGSR